MESELIDKNTLKHFLLNEIDGDKLFFKRLCEHFENNIVSFEKLADSPLEFCQLAHKMRSSCLSFGALSLHNTLVHLDEFKDYTNLTDFRKLYSNTKELLRPTYAEIKLISDEILQTEKKNA